MSTAAIYVKDGKAVRAATTMLPLDVGRAARMRAASDGVSMSDWLRRLVERELQIGASAPGATR